MPFYQAPQSIVTLDIRADKTLVYKQSGSNIYEEQCAAFVDGYVQDIEKYAEHVIRYGTAAEITENDILIVVIPISFSKEIKVYLLNQLFTSLKCYYIRLEYDVSLIMYSIGHITGLIIQEIRDSVYQIVPYVKGRILKAPQYATNQTEVETQIDALLNGGINIFAAQELKEAIIIVQMSNQLNLKHKIFLDLQADAALNDGINVMLHVGNLSSECFVVGQNERWEALMA